MINLPQTLFEPIVIQVIPLFGAQACPEPSNPLVTFILRLAAGHIRLEVRLLSGFRHYFQGGVKGSRARCIPGVEGV
jgi:hypothetical protein